MWSVGLLLLLFCVVLGQVPTPSKPPTKNLVLDFASTLEGVGCDCREPPTQADILAKCATCECSSYGCCTAPDCDNPQCGSCNDCSKCDTGIDGHPCVTTAVQRQCYFAQGTTVLNPFQIAVKMTVVFWDSNAYAWVNYAANSERSSFRILWNDTNVFAGQPSLAKMPGFSGPPKKMFYSTSIFGPLDWSLLAPRFNTGQTVNVEICNDAECVSNVCSFTPDKPVLAPADVGL